MKFHFVFLTLAAGVAGFGRVAAEDESVVPSEGFAAPRYEALWSKSPFAVASPEGVQESPDYSLVGIAQFDGVTYASLIDKKNQDRILVATGKPANGLTLVSVTRGHDANGTTAVLQKNGQTITLKLEQAAAVATNGMPGGAPSPQGAPPAIPMLPMPGSGGEYSGGGGPPRSRFRHPLISVPPPPAPAPQPAQSPADQPQVQQQNAQPAPQFQAPPPPPSQVPPQLPAGLQPPSAPPPQAPPSR